MSINISVALFSADCEEPLSPLENVPIVAYTAMETNGRATEQEIFNICHH